MIRPAIHLNNGEYITDKLDSTEYGTWNPGDKILITGDPNTGKTRFAVNYLNDMLSNQHGGAIYLTNRSILRDQIKNDYHCLFSVENYREFMKDLYFGRSTLNQYAYIVVDEAHFFFTDSYYQTHTDIILNYLLNGCPDSIVVFMASVTGVFRGYVSSHFNATLNHYFFKKAFDFADCYYFDKPAEIADFLDKLQHGKVLYITGKESAEKLYKKLKNKSTLILEDNRYRPLPKKETVQSRDCRNALNKIAALHTFPSQILITGNLLSYGIKLEDVEHVVIDLLDFDIIFQSLGRVLVGNVKPTVYIRNFHRSILKSEPQKRLAIVNKFLNDMELFCYERGHKDLECMVYPVTNQNGNCRYVVNEVALYRFQWQEVVAEVTDQLGFIQTFSRTQNIGFPRKCPKLRRN